MIPPRLCPPTRSCPAARGPTRITRLVRTRTRLPSAVGYRAWKKASGPLGFCAGSRCSTRATTGKRTNSGKICGMSRGERAPLPTCSALIKLAAAGVKVRERRSGGVRTHCHRAAVLFASAAGQGGLRQLGLDLKYLAECARESAENPPSDPGPADAAVTRVFEFRIECAVDFTNHRK